MAETDEVGYFKGLVENPLASLDALSVGVIGIAITVSTGGLGGIVLGGAFAGGSAYFEDYLGLEVTQGIKAWAGDVKKFRPSYIVIAKVHNVEQYCTVS